MVILDQIETDATVFYSGSTSDNVVLGDMFPGGILHLSGFSISGSGFHTRRRVASTKSAGTAGVAKYLAEAWVPAWFIEGYSSGSFLGRTQRFLKYFDASEFFTDSFVPNPVDIHLTNGQAVYFIDQFSWVIEDATESSGSQWGIAPYPSGSGLTLIFDRFPRGGSELTGVSDEEWIFQYPFESKFRQLPRLLSFSTLLPTSYTLTQDTSTNTITPASESNRLCTIITNGPQQSMAVIGVMKRPGEPWLSNGLTDNILGTGSPRDLYNLYFGIGDGITPIDGATASSQIKGPDVRTFDKTFLNRPSAQQVLMIYNISVRGYKYGLKSTSPQNTGMVFRNNRFGQFRDTLEQRSFSKFLDVSEGKQTTTIGPVFVSFVAGTTTFARSVDYVTATNPDYNTKDSGIYDTNYRSGQPFFDG